MGYLRIFLPALALLLGAAACSAPSQDEDTDWTVRQMAAAVWAAGSSLDGTELLPGDELYESYLTDSYGLEAAWISEGALWVAGGTSAQEAAVLHLTGEASSDAVAEVLQIYLEDRTGAFTGYLPEEAALLEQARVVVRGSYVALLACEDGAAAQEAFSQCFTQEPPRENSPAQTPPSPEEPEENQDPASAAGTEPDTAAPSENRPAEEPQPAGSGQESRPSTAPEPAEPALSPEPEVPSEPPAQAEIPWSYSEERLLAAWAAGDWSGLAPEDQAILEVCQEVIRSAVPADGSEYEQELAVHDWMITHGSYDSNTLSQLPDFQENPNNDNPYAFLVDGRGICMGYTTTFQLFMDLLGIPCITVEGTAYHYTEDHAWNQVQLDGEWYCVDVTWDDPITDRPLSASSTHRFFNVTSEFMRDTDHQWDESSVPEAAGTQHAWH